MDGWKAAFKGSMVAYGILAIKSVRWIKHVTGTGGESEAHYWPYDCDVCKQIASHVAGWSDAAEHTLAPDGGEALLNYDPLPDIERISKQGYVSPAAGKA